MTDAARQTAEPDGRAGRGRFVALGILLIVLGVLASLNLLVATVASVYVVGALMLLGGAALIAQAFRSRGWGGQLFSVLSGVLYALAGILAFANPLLASSALTLMLALALLVSGVLRVVVALRERPRRGWGWVLGTGVLSALAGLVVLLGWPVNSLYLLGFLLALDLLLQGAAWLGFGLAPGRR